MAPGWWRPPILWYIFIAGEVRRLIYFFKIMGTISDQFKKDLAEMKTRWDASAARNEASLTRVKALLTELERLDSEIEELLS